MHAKGGLLYMDGANMNALVAKARRAIFGVDVMHLNLHKTFSTPHAEAAGIRPVAVKKVLAPFLPTPVLITKPDGTLGFEYNCPQSVAACARSTEISACSFARWLTSRQRTRRPAPDNGRRGAQRELHPPRAWKALRSAVFDAVHA